MKTLNHLRQTHSLKCDRLFLSVTTRITDHHLNRIASQPELALVEDFEGQLGFPFFPSTSTVKSESLDDVADPTHLDAQIAAAMAFDEDPAVDPSYGIIQPEQLVVVKPYGDDSDDILLSELRPRWIVMYDPNQDFLRRVEVRVYIFNISPRV